MAKAKAKTATPKAKPTKQPPQPVVASARKAKPAAAGPDARNPTLEAAILANPKDRDAWAVFGDWLQEQNDPRGELIALHLANKDKAAQKLIDQHAAYFLGPLAEHVEVRDEGYNNSSSHLRTKEQEEAWQKVHKQAFLWRNGFIHRVRLSHDEYSDSEWEGETSEVLAQVLAHPSGRYVSEFSFQSNGDPSDGDLQSIIDVLAKHAPPTTRKLTFGDNVDQISWHHTGDLGKLWKRVPNLEILEIETGEFEVGKLVLPNLRRAVFITGGLTSSCGKAIAKADLPAIEHLEIYYGSTSYGGSCTIKDVTPLLQRTDLTKLKYLGLENSQFSNEIAQHLASAKILKGIETLDLSGGSLTDEGAKALVEAKSALAHLAVLDLSTNYLTKEGVRLVKGLAKKVIVDSQGTPYQRSNGELVYFISISE